MDPNWDPMKEDFNDPRFNSYDSGIGKNLPISHQVARHRNDQSHAKRDGIQLYVTGIPIDLNEEGLLNLFSQAGTVTNVKKLRPKKEGSIDTIGFITFTTAKEAELAIRMFDNFKMLEGRFRLHVKLAMSEEEKRLKKQKEAEEAAFLHDLPSERMKRPQGVQSAGEESRIPMGRGALASNVIRKEPTPASTPKPQLNGHRNDSDTGSVGSSRGQISPAMPPQVGSSRENLSVTSAVGGQRNVNVGGPGPGKVSGKRGEKKPRPCAACGKSARSECSSCKTPYCGKTCQGNDWPKHKLLCKEISKQKSQIEQMNEFESRFEIELGDDDFVAKALAKDCKVPSDQEGSKAATLAQMNGQPQAYQVTRLMYRDAEKVKLNDDDQVMVTSLDSLMEFWVVNKLSIHILSSLKAEMDKYYSTTINTGSSSYVPELGQMCAAQWVQDDQGWYRARVDRLKLDGAVAVTFVDYGNKTEMSIAHVRRLEKQFSMTPLQATCCRLHKAENCLNPNEPGTLQRCKELLNSQTLFKVKVILRGNESVIVELETVDGGDNITSILEKEGIFKVQQQPRITSTPVNARPSSVTPPPPKVESPMPSPASIQSTNATPTLSATPSTPSDMLPPPHLPTSAKYLTKAQEIVIDIISAPHPSEFWAQVVSNSQIKELDGLHFKMCQHYERLPAKKGFRPLQSKLYAAKFQNEWYRAQVFDFNTTQAHVIYLDYGNREWVDFSKLHSLESDFSSLPFQAVRFALYGICPVNGSDVWTQEAKKFFCSHLSSNLKARVCDKDEVLTYIELILSDGETLNHKLVQSGHARQVGRLATSPPTSTPSQTAAAQSPMTKPKATTELPKLDIPAGDSNVLVADAPSPLNIVVNLLEGELNQSLVAVCQAMSQCKKPSKPHIPVVGELVIALFAADQSWYRAKVKEVRSPKEIYVYFVDYGNTECVTSDVVIPMPEEMTLYPALGVVCRLSGIEGIASGVPWDASLVVNRQFVMKVVSKDLEKLAVDLTDASTGVSINKQLLEAGVVLPCSSKGVTAGTVVSLKDLVVPDYKPGDVIERVCVTDATGPTDFTVQNMSMAEKHLPKLEEQLQKIHMDYVGNYIPNLEELVSTRYSDGCWYRASADDVKDQTVSLTLIDYGNKQIVKGDAINKIEHLLLEFPVLGIPCTLAGVTGVPGNRQWDPQLLWPLAKIFKAKVVSVSNGVHTVELLDQESGTCLNRELLTAGAVLGVEKKTSQALEAKKQEPVVAVTALPKPKSPEPAPEKPKEAPRLKVADLSQLTLQEDVLGVVIYLSSPEEFYIQSAEQAQDFAMFSMQFNTTYAADKEQYTPEAGELVAAFCKSDGAWYRAEVKDLGAGSVQVLYVDFGNEDTVTASDVRKLKPEFLQVPQMAVKCKFQEKFSEEAAKILKEKTSDVAVGFLFSGCVDGVHIVKDIFNAENGSCILKELVEMGLMPSETPQVPEAVSEPVPFPPDLFDGRNLKIQHLPDSNVKVKVVHINDPGHFFLQINESWCEIKIIKVLTAINQYCESSPTAYMPQAVGEIVCAKLDIWYRAVVKEIKPDLTCMLDFIDFGNIEAVPAQNIRVILKEFIELERQGIPCRILDLKGTGSDGQWTSADTAWFQEQFPDSKVVALKPTNIKDGEVNCIDLIVEEGRTASQLMLEQKHAVRSTATTAETQKTPSFEANEPPKLQRELPAETKLAAAPVASVTPNNAKLSDLPKNQPKSLMDVVVIFVANPGKFYVQEASPQAQKQLAKIKESMLTNCRVTGESFSAKVGELCACFHEGYSEWYRAVILSISPDATRYKVQFIDYGDMEKVPSTALRPLPTELSGYAPVALECALGGISPVDQTWTPASRDLFMQLTISEPPVIHSMHILDRNGATQVVSLINQQTGANARDLLIREGIGVAMATGSDGNEQPPALDPLPHDGPPVDRPSAPPVLQPQPGISPTVEHVLRQENAELRNEMAELWRQMTEMMQFMKQQKS